MSEQPIGAKTGPTGSGSTWNVQDQYKQRNQQQEQGKAHDPRKDNTEPEAGPAGKTSGGATGGGLGMGGIGAGANSGPGTHDNQNTQTGQS